jgi:hypothetical protein
MKICKLRAEKVLKHWPLVFIRVRAVAGSTADERLSVETDGADDAVNSERIIRHRTFLVAGLFKKIIVDFCHCFDTAAI